MEMLSKYSGVGGQGRCCDSLILLNIERLKECAKSSICFLFAKLKAYIFASLTVTAAL